MVQCKIGVSPRGSLPFQQPIAISIKQTMLGGFGFGLVVKHPLGFTIHWSMNRVHSLPWNQVTSKTFTVSVNVTCQDEESSSWKTGTKMKQKQVSAVSVSMDMWVFWGKIHLIKIAVSEGFTSFMLCERGSNSSEQNTTYLFTIPAVLSNHIHLESIHKLYFIRLSHLRGFI